MSTAPRKPELFRPASNELAPIPNKAAIDKVQKHGWIIQDEPGTFEMIDKSLLNIDYEYQREQISHPRINSIRKAWSWIACATLTVGRRPDGVLVVIDGQHRLMAALNRSDIQQLPCLVFQVENIAQEASGFVRINTNRGPMKSVAHWKASLRSGDPIYLGANQMIADFGYRVTASGNSRGTVGCVHTILKLYTQDADLCREVFALACEAAKGDQIIGRVLEGIFFLENRLRDPDCPVREKSLLAGPLRDRLVKLGQDAIQASIAEAQNYEQRSGPKVFAIGVARCLDKGLREANRLQQIFNK